VLPRPFPGGAAGADSSSTTSDSVRALGLHREDGNGKSEGVGQECRKAQGNELMRARQSRAMTGGRENGRSTNENAGGKTPVAWTGEDLGGGQ